MFVNFLGKYNGYIVKIDIECYNIMFLICFCIIILDFFFVYMLKIIFFCNEKYSCNLEFIDVNFFVRIFIILCGCCIIYLYYIRVGVFFECLFSKYFNNLKYCF